MAINSIARQIAGERSTTISCWRTMDRKTSWCVSRWLWWDPAARLAPHISQWILDLVTLVVGGCSRHRQRFIFGALLLCVTLLYFWMHSMTFVVDALKNRTISSINLIKISNVSCSQTGSWEAISLSLTWMLQVVVLPGHQYHLVQRLRQESDKATPWLRHHHAPLLMLKGSP